MTIFWFRRDLRLDDNIGLYHALTSVDEVLPIFIFDEAILSQLPKDDARVTFIHDRLTTIQHQLKEIGKSLAVFHGKPIQIFEKLIRKAIPVRRLGSAALDLCWTAAGRFDGFYEHKLQAWDSAAGFLIVEEAGGKVTDLQGNPYTPYNPGIIATNGKIHQQLQSVINGGTL